MFSTYKCCAPIGNDVTVELERLRAAPDLSCSVYLFCDPAGHGHTRQEGEKDHATKRRTARETSMGGPES
jgi:hypothetical protein